MLEKVENINPKGSFKQKDRKRKKESAYHAHFVEKHFIKDSIVLSPAAQFLANLNWTLKDIQYLSNDKILLNFLIDEVEFYTEIDLDKLYTEEMQLFHILKSNVKYSGEEKILIQLMIYKDMVKTVDDDLKFEIPVISDLFDKVFDLKLKTDIGKEDYVLLRNLIEDIEEQLVEEFQYVLYGIYTFLDKLGKFNLVKNYLFNYDIDNPLRIEKITVIHE